MQTVQIIGEHLYEKLLIAITCEINRPFLSFAIDVRFIENGKKIIPAKLVLHTREHLTENVFSFTGTLYIEKIPLPCMGCYYKDEECWLTIIKPTKEVLKVNISKTEFINKAKEYYQNNGLKFSEDGNLKESFPLFRNIPKKGDFNGILKVNDGKYEFDTKIFNNLFSIMIKEKDAYILVFGEYVEENLVKTCSIEEACLRGIKIS